MNSNYQVLGPAECACCFESFAIVQITINGNINKFNPNFGEKVGNLVMVKLRHPKGLFCVVWANNFVQHTKTWTYSPQIIQNYMKKSLKLVDYYHINVKNV